MTASLTANQAKHVVKESGYRNNVKRAINIASPSSGLSGGFSMSKIFGTSSSTTNIKKTKEKHWLVVLLEQT